MYEYKVRRYTKKRAKNRNSIGSLKNLNSFATTEQLFEDLINNECKDGWEFFFKDARYFYFRKIQK
jgi:hypothetical protein